MALTPRLDLRHAQTLVMTPQLQQAIKLLHMSAVELEVYVDEALIDNPLLERVEPDATPGEAEPPEAVGDAAEEPLDLDAAHAFDEEPGGASLADWPTAGPRGDGDLEGFEERTADRPKSLREHLAEQLAIDVADPGDRLIGTALIDLLDESGYLTTPLAEIAAELGAPPERVAAVLAQLKRCDPPGLFAANLKECLALQLADRNRLDPAMAALLDNLPLLARRDFAALKRLCGVDDSDLKDMIAEIRTLNPKPGQAFEARPVETLIPDILVRARPGGGYLVELNSDALPRLIVNSRYYAEVLAHAKTKSSRDFVAERHQTANWLVRALDQRAQTILKVAIELVKQQERFLRIGVQGLKPLVLRDIAQAISMHESTVSRVTANKTMATPRGLFDLKYFFTSSIASAAGGEAHSAEAVKSRIKALIEAEDPHAVLSDDRLVVLLRGAGIDIARRTVAKYREALKIPSSVQRRLDKALDLPPEADPADAARSSA